MNIVAASNCIPPRDSSGSDGRNCEAVEFLETLRPGGPWILTAISPTGGKIETITAMNTSAVLTFVRANEGRNNLYYSVNPTRSALTRKAAKTDIASIEFFIADLDPAEGESSEAAKQRFLAALGTYEPKPTAIVDSGNGIQALWRLKDPIKLPEPMTVKDKKVFPPEIARVIADVEARVAAQMNRLGSIAGTQNIDRIMRVPGTTNLPNAKKTKAGRIACPTRLISFTEVTCGLEDFPAAEEFKNDTSSRKEKADYTIDWGKVDSHTGWLNNVADLPSDFSAKGRMIVAHVGNLPELNSDLEQAGLIDKKYDSWSGVSFALAAVFNADGRFTPEEIAAALMCDLACNQHVTKHSDVAKLRRAVERAITRSHESAATRVARALNWRERRANGSPLPTMYNARLAITALGVQCSRDTFHNKTLFGYSGDSMKHELQSLVGEVTDDGILMLRQMMSKHFGVDLEDKATRDAVKSLALEHCFDPVRDMLDEAEKNYDGVPRLDRMAVDYFNADDTSLNRAIMRKTMIAAVRRARDPGCKFDTVTVMESPEGWNKSTAWRVLAGNDNFSDESILGRSSREVQEQLSGVWIHENADLAGMRKAEVEHVKAFASRQVDRARPAYGHYVVNQPRHSIEIATTNSDEYLQSQDGNRRFWPLAVRTAIDLDLLRRDRLQLWGEAAKWESEGESITLDETLWPKARDEQEKRRTRHPWEDVLADIPDRIVLDSQTVQIIHRVEGQERVKSSDLLTHVLRIPVWQQRKDHTMQLSTIMKLAGWERNPNKVTVGGKQVRGYFRWVDGRLPL